VRRSWMVKDKLLMLLIATIALLWSPGNGSARPVRKDPEDSAKLLDAASTTRRRGPSFVASHHPVGKSLEMLQCLERQERKRQHGCQTC
jgi:hypothetical protein